MAQARIERFFLYGEAPRPVNERFVHLEFLDDRSRPANWIIRPHSHVDLHHVFYLQSGAGTAEADGGRLTFSAPCIVVAPAGIVHGFAWKEESAGRVLTFSASHLRGLAGRDSSLQTPFDAGMWTAKAEAETWEDMLGALARELSWMALAHDIAIEFRLGAVLVHALRLHHEASAEAHTPIGPKALLVARYRACVEQQLRSKPSIASLAGDLGVSVSTLRAACQECAGKSPADILHERATLEARRLMRYSNMSVGQIATYLGFSDAAYFSRFFSRETGASPRAFKQTTLPARR